ncbi:CopK family periplasmic copper-binding protein [Polaromonas glacialis]|uniref:CopK family periplasmic copper-binding protein n=1 Tax=Polaromonas glacialis TaxID=866564 RepID=UPI00049614B3|nr:CopK family periplasmic copper-binding protein [Polaromonas glacialis]
MSIVKTVVGFGLIFSGLSAFSVDQAGIEKSVELKDGSTVHLFKDGKMAMENKFGRPYRMQEGEMMQTKDGKSIAMKGDEVARLSNAMRTHLSR